MLCVQSELELFFSDLFYKFYKVSVYLFLMYCLYIVYFFYIILLMVILCADKTLDFLYLKQLI